MALTSHSLIRSCIQQTLFEHLLYAGTLRGKGLHGEQDGPSSLLVGLAFQCKEKEQAFDNGASGALRAVRRVEQGGGQSVEGRQGTLQTEQNHTFSLGGI